MSWRRFLVLLDGLSVNSAWVTVRANGDQLITDEAGAARAFEQLF